MSNNTQEEKDKTTLKEAVKRQLLDLTILLDECEDNEAIKILNNKITAAKNLFIAVKEKRCQLPLKLVTRSPANKHITPQRKFKSTKKRKRTCKDRFAKPNKEEIATLFTRVTEGEKHE